jgi:hypothetical protein
LQWNVSSGAQRHACGSTKELDNWVQWRVCDACVAQCAAIDNNHRLLIFEHDEVTFTVIRYEEAKSLSNLEMTWIPIQYSLGAIEVHAASIANGDCGWNFLSLRWRLRDRYRGRVSHAKCEPSNTFHEAAYSNFEIQATYLSLQPLAAKKNCLGATRHPPNIVEILGDGDILGQYISGEWIHHYALASFKICFVRSVRVAHYHGVTD